LLLLELVDGQRFDLNF